MPCIDADVVIAGGGIAGVATAAALREFGWSVLIVEPGQHAGRRLAGELIHPPGVAGLAELGLRDGCGLADAVPMRGFCVFSEANETGIRLPYGNRGVGAPAGFALEHGAIRASLAASAERMPHVTLWQGARVQGLELSRPALPVVAIARGGKVVTLRCRMVVGADGAASPVRSMAGIVHQRRRISYITSYVINSGALPAPGFGHVFIGKTAPLLAYEIGRDRARVLFDHPIGSAEDTSDGRVIAGLPRSFRTAVVSAISAQRGLGCASADVLVEATGRSALVLVGDAGGSCHPLTATGMSVAISDALRLRQALRDRDGDVVRGIVLYTKRRRAPQRARHLLASALHETCSRQDGPARLIRDGLIDYWQRNARGREASMALLAMTDTRVISILREMASILLLGVAPAMQRQRALPDRLLVSMRLTLALSALLLRYIPLVMKAR